MDYSKRPAARRLPIVAVLVFLYGLGLTGTYAHDSAVVHHDRHEGHDHGRQDRQRHAELPSHHHDCDGLAPGQCRLSQPEPPADGCCHAVHVALPASPPPGSKSWTAGDWGRDPAVVSATPGDLHVTSWSPGNEPFRLDPSVGMASHAAGRAPPGRLSV